MPTPVEVEWVPVEPEVVSGLDQGVVTVEWVPVSATLESSVSTTALTVEWLPVSPTTEQAEDDDEEDGSAFLMFVGW